jgi:hypothetical protein
MKHNGRLPLDEIGIRIFYTRRASERGSASQKRARDSMLLKSVEGGNFGPGAAFIWRMPVQSSHVRRLIKLRERARPCRKQKQGIDNENGTQIKLPRRLGCRADILSPSS